MRNFTSIFVSILILALTLNSSVFADTTFTVTTTDDLPDSNSGGGGYDLVCEDGTGDCTLRAALETANVMDENFTDGSVDFAYVSTTCNDGVDNDGNDNDDYE